MALKSRSTFFSEQNTDFSARAYIVIPHYIIRVVVPNRDPVSLTVLDWFFSAKAHFTPQQKKSP